MDAEAEEGGAAGGPGKVNSPAETYVRRHTGTRRSQLIFLLSGECASMVGGHVTLPAFPLFSPPFPLPRTCPLLDIPVSFPAPPSPLPPSFPRPDTLLPLSVAVTFVTLASGTQASRLCLLALRLAEVGHRLLYFFHRPHLVTHVNFTILKTFPHFFLSFLFLICIHISYLFFSVMSHVLGVRGLVSLRP